MNAEDLKISVSPGLTLAEFEKILIEKTLTFTGGNKSKAARILGISQRTLRYKTNGK